MIMEAIFCSVVMLATMSVMDVLDVALARSLVSGAKVTVIDKIMDATIDNLCFIKLLCKIVP